MIRVTIELVPLGIEDRKEKLGVIEVHNTLKNPSHPMWGTYIAKFKTAQGEDQVEVKNHFRAAGVLRLISDVMKAWEARR